MWSHWAAAGAFSNADRGLLAGLVQSIVVALVGERVSQVEPTAKPRFGEWFKGGICSEVQCLVVKVLKNYELPKIVSDEFRQHLVVACHANIKASIVVLFADDLLQRFAQKVLEKKIGLEGYGPLYRSVHLTSLLRATTNCVRHVSEWEDYPFPYRELKDAESNDERAAIRNITILQGAYGLGRHERIRDFVSWHTVVTIDGLYGAHPPDYQRFEDALIEGARGIAKCAGGTALADLEKALRRSAS